MFCICFLAMIHLCAHMISVVVLRFLYVLCDWARCLLIVFFSVHEDFGDNFSDYYKQDYGSKVFHWSLHLSWFWEWQNTPVSSFLSSLLISNIPFNTLLISQWMDLFQGAFDQFYVGVVFSSCFLLAIFCTAFVTSFLIIILFSLMDGVMNFSIGFMLPFLN